MAITQIDNIASISGLLGATTFTDTKSTVATVFLSGLDFTKEANQDIWINGDLIYTLKVTNESTTENLTNIVIKDTLEMSVFEYIQDSVEIVFAETELEDTQFTAVYNGGTGELTITITDSALILNPSEIMTVSFRGSKIEP